MLQVKRLKQEYCLMTSLSTFLFTKSLPSVPLIHIQNYCRHIIAKRIIIAYGSIKCILGWPFSSSDPNEYFPTQTYRYYNTLLPKEKIKTSVIKHKKPWLSSAVLVCCKWKKLYKYESTSVTQLLSIKRSARLIAYVINSL